MIGLGFFGSYLVWVGLLFGFVCTLLRKRELELDAEFSNNRFWQLIVITLVLAAFGILATEFLIGNCEAAATENPF